MVTEGYDPRMAVVLQPWQILVTALAGWISSQQDAVIEYLREENRVLKQQLGVKRLRLTDAQRRRLAVRGKGNGRSAKSLRSSLPTPSYAGTGNSLPGSGLTDGAPRVAPESCKRSES